jgi:hypothetical protein
MNHSLWPVAIIGGIVCTYLPIGSADTAFVPEPAAPSDRVAVAQPMGLPEPTWLLAAADSDKGAASSASASTATTTTTTTTPARVPTADEVRAAIHRGTDKAVEAGKHAGEAAKQEWHRFEQAHPEATRRSTTTITTGDAKAPLVIRQQPASQP